MPKRIAIPTKMEDLLSGLTEGVLGDPKEAMRGPTMMKGLKKAGKGSIGKLPGLMKAHPYMTGAAFLAPYILSILGKAMGPDLPEVQTAEEMMGQLELQMGLERMQSDVARQDPGMYTALLQFLSGQSPVTGMSENAVRFGGAPRQEADDATIQQALMQMLQGGGGLG